MTEQKTLPKPARERGKIAPTKLAHIVMRTSRYREMVDWYKTVLEAEAAFSDSGLSFLTYDEEHHRIAIIKMPLLLRRPGFMAGVEHTAFTYADIGELLSTYKRLKGLGIEPYWCINHGATTSMYYADPDGNRVELQIDNYKDQAGLDEFLRGSGFKMNPIGIDYDPDDLCRRYDAGESHEQLVRWGEVEPRGLDSIPSQHLGRLHSLLSRLASRTRK